MSSFGSRFKDLRLMRDLTQDQLVSEFNLKYGYIFTKSAVSQYENDKRLPEINVLKDFADFFNVSVDYLLNGNVIAENRADYLNKIENEHAIDLKELGEIIKIILKTKNIMIDDKSLDKDDLKLFSNCIDIGIELVNKNNKEELNK